MEFVGFKGYLNLAMDEQKTALNQFVPHAWFSIYCFMGFNFENLQIAFFNFLIVFMYLGNFLATMVWSSLESCWLAGACRSDCAQACTRAAPRKQTKTRSLVCGVARHLFAARHCEEKDIYICKHACQFSRTEK